MSEAMESPMSALKERVVADPFFSFAETVQTADSMDETETARAGVLAPFGIDHFVLFQVADRGKRPTAARMRGPQHSEWRAHYVESGYANRDEFMLSGLDQAVPKTWTKYQNEHEVSKSQQRIFD